MTLTEASQYLYTGIKRAGWEGYIKADESGRIWFVDGEGSTWYWIAYKQDIDADDWERVSE